MSIRKQSGKRGMANKDVFDRYLLELHKTALDDKTEHTDRAALPDRPRASLLQ